MNSDIAGCGLDIEFYFLIAGRIQTIVDGTRDVAVDGTDSFLDASSEALAMGIEVDITSGALDVGRADRRDIGRKVAGSKFGIEMVDGALRDGEATGGEFGI